MPDLGALCDAANHWPLPGSGGTGKRFTLLESVAREDLSVGRLVEAHADAVAVLAELAGPPVEGGQRWGVWAAGPPDSVTASLEGGHWLLNGTKRWCSGAKLLTHALVDSMTEDGSRLFAVDLSTAGVKAAPSDWTGHGLSRTDTRSVSFTAVEATPVGEIGQYLTRPGFWAGSVGVAACWLGGTVAVAERLSRADRAADAHFLVHLASVHCALTAGRTVIADAAERIDSAPARDHRIVAVTARSVVERVATQVLDHVGQALGPGPLAHEGAHAALVADLTVYIRQHHGPRDLAELGRALLVSGGLPG